MFKSFPYNFSIFFFFDLIEQVLIDKFLKIWEHIKKRKSQYDVTSAAPLRTIFFTIFLLPFLTSSNFFHSFFQNYVNLKSFREPPVGDSP